MIYGPTSVLAGRGRVYGGRFGDAPFQRLYSGQNYFNPLWAPYLALCLLLPALLNPYLLVLPVAGLTALAGIYVWRGVGMARREGLRPIWRLGPLLGLLHLLPLLARWWGRLRVRWPYTSTGTGSSCWRLRSVGGGLFLAEGVEEVGRSTFLEGLRGRLRTARLHPEMPSGWHDADIICNSALFWRAQMVSYEAWGTLYLRLTCNLRFCRLTLPAAGIAFVLLWWSALAAAGLIVGFSALLLFDRRLFARNMRRTLTEDSRQSWHG